MKDPQQKELEQMALSAELARQVVHDCNNFLYNVLLQAELTEKLPHENRPDWSGLKREAKHLANRLQEWHDYGRALSSERSDIELNSVIQGVVTDLLPEGSFRQRLAPDPLWLRSLPNEVKCLCCFVLQSVLVPPESNGDDTASPLIQTEKKADTILLRITGIQHAGDALHGLPGGESDDPETGRPSLVINACKAIAVRLDARIYLENDAGRPVALLLEFPFDLS